MDHPADPLTDLPHDERIRSRKLADGVATIIVDATGLIASESEDARGGAARGRACRSPGVSEARIAMTASQAARTLIAIGSGKGGVGKSTVSANLAIALGQNGQEGRADRRRRLWARRSRRCSARTTSPTAENDKLIPVEAHGIRFLSLGQLVSPGHALAWRGPMATGALANLVEADWGDAELLLVDLPPGTGDVQLSLIQRSRPAGAVIVSTPQDLSLIDARRAVDLFNKTSVPVLGHHREHGDLRLPALRRGVAPVRDRRRRGGGGRDGRAVPRPAAAVARRSAKRPTRAIRRLPAMGPKPKRSPHIAAKLLAGLEALVREGVIAHAADPRRGHCRASDQRAHDRRGRRVGPARAARPTA